MSDSAALLDLLDGDERADLAEALFGARAAAPAAFERLVADTPMSELLAQIIALRLPFLHMIDEVCRFLGSRDVRSRSTAQIVALPGTELRFDFGPQIRELVATGMSFSSLRKHAGEIEERAAAVVFRARFLSGIEPTAVTHDTPASAAFAKVLAARGMNSHLREKLGYSRPDGVLHLLGRESVREWHPADTAALREIVEAVASAGDLAARLSADKPDGVIGQVRNRLRRISNAAQEKHADAVPRTSKRRPYAKLQIDSGRKKLLLSAVDLLKERLFAASTAAEAETALADFMALGLWKHRWRIYELWTLVRLLLLFHRLGFDLDLSRRVENGVWSLRFANDKLPIATLRSSDTLLEVFYQLHDTTEFAGMPDIAVRRSTGEFVVVIDPKHGTSYSRSDVAAVAATYASTFQASLTMIHNYYAMPYQAETISTEPLSMIFSDVRPGGSTVAAWDAAIERAIPPEWIRRRRLVAAVVDVSDSMAAHAGSISAALVTRVRRAQSESLADASLVIFFSSTAQRTSKLLEVDDALEIAPMIGGGTDLMGAFQLALKTPEAAFGPFSVWLFSDGEDRFDVEEVARSLRERGAHLEVYESSLRPSGDSVLKQLADLTGGLYQKI
ncbi:MAG TPA: vWA domain-containing protein [Candidatus Elarobacter sp.]|nr:vWA domain-containing protein [Candidatus Elarobacter sp.]